MARVMAVTTESVALAAQIVREGGVIAIPTDTVYGVACDPTNTEAVEQLFQVKQRPREKTVQILVAHLDDIAQFGLQIPFPLDAVAKELCPGGFSPICDVVDTHTALVTTRTVEQLEEQLEGHKSQHTQAIRVPDNALTQQILRACGPLAASSANISGMQAASDADEVVRMLGDRVDLILDGGPTPGPVASTVASYDSSEPAQIRILREGTIPAERVRAIAQAAVRSL